MTSPLEPLKKQTFGTLFKITLSRSLLPKSHTFSSPSTQLLQYALRSSQNVSPTTLSMCCSRLCGLTISFGCLPTISMSWICPSSYPSANIGKVGLNSITVGSFLSGTMKMSLISGTSQTFMFVFPSMSYPKLTSLPLASQKQSFFTAPSWASLYDSINLGLGPILTKTIVPPFVPNTIVLSPIPSSPSLKPNPSKLFTGLLLIIEVVALALLNLTSLVAAFLCACTLAA
mmetsp:Transcript_8441/g.17076  ORF Transcript_8441/g.17076 Transcript_8441/m.17076 type:complete len:230 (-) Transcript_8441:742-1431(-)